jgi:hypothetical protein
MTALGNCPDCNTPLERVRGRRSRTFSIWCWKCQRTMRMGEAVRAKREALANEPPLPDTPSERSDATVRGLTEGSDA